MMFFRPSSFMRRPGWRWVAAVTVGGSLLLARRLIRGANDTTDARLDTPSATTPPHDGPARVDLQFVPDRLFIHYDKGQPIQGRQVALHLVNLSADPVRILHITSSCGCTVVDAPSQDTLAPGEETNLRVRVHVPALGEKVSIVEVHTDAGRLPVARARLVLRGETPSAPYVSSVPAGISLSCVEGESLSHEIVIAAIEEAASPNWITSLAADADNLEIAAADVHQKAGPTPETCVKMYRYELRTTAPERAQRIDFRLAVRTAAAKPVAFIPVSLDVRPLVSATPGSVYVKVSSSNEFPIERVVNIRDERSAPDRGEFVTELNDRFITVATERLPATEFFATRLRLRIEELPGDLARRAGVYKAILTLSNGLQGAEQLRIPIVIETHQPWRQVR